jgi:hypothetical protein
MHVYFVRHGESLDNFQGKIPHKDTRIRFMFVNFYVEIIR